MLSTKIEVLVDLGTSPDQSVVDKTINELKSRDGIKEAVFKNGAFMVDTTLPSSVVLDAVSQTAGKRAVLQGFGDTQSAVAMVSSPDARILGVVRMQQQGSSFVADGSVDGLTPGPHGLHLHETGDLSEGCRSLGPHYNPWGGPHGAPAAARGSRHAGDLGNILADDRGRATFRIVDTVLNISDIIGRSIAITERADDLGRGSSPTSKIDGDSGPPACSLCGENCKDEATLHEHVRERHRHRETQCQECDMTFASEASRSVHYERVHLKVKVRRCLPKTGRKYDRYGDHFMCEMCGKKCQNNIALKYHIRSHTGEKPHACPHCPKHYSTPVALQYHIRSHTGDKPLACPHCPLRYATHKGLQTHLLKHTGERPFKCDLCGKAFTQKTMLQKHKTVHTGEKPFSCEICGKAFTQSGSVHTHVKYVHKKLPAPPRNRGKREKPD